MKKLICFLGFFFCLPLATSCELPQMCNGESVELIPSLAGGGDDEDEYIIQVLLAINNAPIADATILIYDHYDNNVIAADVTNPNGEAVFAIPYGEYRVDVLVSEELVLSRNSTFSAIDTLVILEL